MVVSFFKSSEPVGEVGTQIFSIDCFLRDEKTEDNAIAAYLLGIRSFFMKLFMTSVLPFLLFIMSLVTWRLLYLKNPDKEVIRSKSISSVVILLFLVHPNIVTYVFNAFK